MPLLINPGSRSRRKIDISALLARAGVKKNSGSAAKKNRRKAKKSVKRNRVRARTKNSLVVNRARRNKGHRKHAREHTRRRKSNPLVVNGRGARKNRRKGAKRYEKRSYKRSGRYARKNSGRRKNPLMVNPSSSPLAMVTTPLSRLLAKIPVLGKILSPAATLLGTAVVGVAAAAAFHFGMGVVAPYLPEAIRPFKHTVVGSVGAALLKMGPKFPYRDQIALAFPVVGGALDVYEWYGGGAMSGYGALSGWGEVPDDGTPYAAHEYADANVMDAEHCGEDLSEEECQLAAMGRKAWWMRFRTPREQTPATGASYHAGRPGGKHGWLIYWIGFDNFRTLSQFPPDHRRKIIHDFRIKAHEIASLALQHGLPDTTVQTAAQAGLLPLPGQ